MGIESILAELDAEISRLTQVRSLLVNSGKANGKLTARKGIKAPSTGRKRVLSADARKRIADAQRRRWAAQRSKSK